MHAPRLAAIGARTLLATFVCVFVAPSVGLAATGYSIEKIAVEGEAAPGTGGDAYGEFFSVTLNESGTVAFGVPLASGAPATGIFADAGAGPVLRFRDGEPAPTPVSGSYLGFVLTAGLDDQDRVATSALVDTGSGSQVGMFLDTAGSDATLVVQGDAAPSPPSGTLDLLLAGTSFFRLNGDGDLAFRSTVSGGTSGRGLFLRTAAGVLSAVALEGGLAGAGPETYQSFEPPALSDAGHVAFGASLAGGSAPTGLFLDAGSGPATLAHGGDAAPDSGGSSFVDFAFADVNVAGQVVFLSNLSGGTATGGVFVADPTVAAVAVENQSVPGAGPITGVSSVPDIIADGRVALSLGFGSGPVSSGVFLVSGGVFDEVVRAGDAAPDTGGALFDAFGFLSANDAGQVAFMATLDDGRTGAFLATPNVPKVPLLPSGVWVVGAALLAVSGRRFLRSA